MKELIEKRLGAGLSSSLKEIVGIADEGSYPIYLVGGFVRDIPLKRENLDIDIVVEGDAIALSKDIAVRLGCKVKIHERFGTTVITLPNGFKIDTASARSETYKTSGALPTVKLYTSIEEDLKRRDFTINSMAIRLNGDKAYTLLDPFHGQDDLKRGIISLLHNKSLIDDPTRILRGIRFEQRFKFNFSPETAKLFMDAIDDKRLDSISPIRFYNELKLILKEDKPLPAIRRMGEMDLFRYVDEGLTYRPETEIIFRRIDETISVLENKESIDKSFVYLLALTAELPSETIKEICRKFSINERDREAISYGRENEERIVTIIDENINIDNNRIYRLLSPFRKEYLVYLASKHSRIIKDKILLYLNSLFKVKIEIDGDDLISLGIKEGTKIGKILSAVMDKRLNGSIGSRVEELDFVKNRFLSDINKTI